MKCFVFLLVYLFKSVSSSTVHHDMIMINDVTASYEMPLKVEALLSWPTVKKQRFVRFMTEAKISAASFPDRMISKQLIFNNKVLIVVDLEHERAFEFLKYANDTGKLQYPNRWLIIDKNLNSSSNPPEAMDGFKILPNTEVILARPVSNNSYNLHQIYKVNKDRQWILEHFGFWTPEKGFQKSRAWNPVTALRRKDLRGEPLVTAAVLSGNDSSTELWSLKDVVKESYHKLTFYHLLHVYEFLNITRTLKFSNSWSSVGNSLSGGIVGEVVHGDAQLAGSMLLFTKERLQVLDYISQPYTASIVFVFREPRISYQNNLFLLPFKVNVWFSILGFTAIFIIIMYIITKWEEVVSDSDHLTQNSNVLKPSFSDITIVAISAIAQQGIATEMRGGRGRTIIFLLFMISLFLYTSYSASIVVLLQTSSSQIRSLQDLLHSRLELGVENTTYNRKYFTTATDPIRKAIYEKKIAPPGAKPKFMSMADGVKKLQTEPFAFNMYARMGYRLISNTFLEHEKCGLREIAYIKDTPWYTCKKNSPYREMYKLALCRVGEHGLISRTNRIFLSDKPACIVRGGAFVSVQLVDFYPALLMLSYGVLCAVLVLLLEIFVHNRTKLAVVIEG